MPHSAMRHTRSVIVACSGSSMSEPRPRQNMKTPALETWVAFSRYTSRPAMGAHSATAMGQGVNTSADSSTL